MARPTNYEHSQNVAVTGNLALAPQRRPHPQPELPTIDPERIREERRQQRIIDEIVECQQLFAVAITRRAQSHVLGKVAVVSALAIALIFIAVAAMHSVLTNIGFQNTKLNSEIVELERQNAMLSEKLEGSAGLLPSAREAMNKYGLVEPNGSQIIKVALPEADRIILASGEEISLKFSDQARQRGALESYFANLQKEHAR